MLELGMTVHDREQASPDDAVVVNRTDIPANEYTYYEGHRKMTVAEANPEYDENQDVVVVVFEDVLSAHGGEFKGDSPIALEALSKHDIPHYAFPPGRLIPVDADTDYISANPSEILPSGYQLNCSSGIQQATIRHISRTENRLIESADGVNIGPVPFIVGDRVPVVTLDDSHPAKNAEFAFCVPMLGAIEDVSTHSSVEYVQSMSKMTRLSTHELQQQLSQDIDFDIVDFPVSTSNKSQHAEADPNDRTDEDSTVQNTKNRAKEQESDEDLTTNNKDDSNNTKSVSLAKKDEDMEQPSESSESSQNFSKSANNEKGEDVSNSMTESSLSELRKEARNQETDAVNSTKETSTYSTQEYTRSGKVREYVKQRADGICEGCGEPAPFTSKTGDPYLHAHHVHELSDGGSDTIDTVIALCPNCHYRVHHGQDADTYNDRLKNKLQEIEDT